MLFFVIFLSFSVFGILHAKRYRLHITEDSVEVVSLFQHKNLHLNQVTQAQWHGKGYLPCQLNLQTPNAKASILLRNFSREQAKKTILFFRCRFPESIQIDWEKFWEIAWPLFDEMKEIRPEDNAPSQRMFKRLVNCLGWFGLILLAVSDIFAWRNTEELLWLVQLLGTISVICFLATDTLAPLFASRFVLILRIWPPVHITIMGGFYLLFALFFPFLVMASGVFERNSLAEFLFATVSMFVLLLIALFWSAYQHGQSYQQWNRMAARKAAELYPCPTEKFTLK